MRIINVSADMNSQIKNAQSAHKPKQNNEATLTEVGGENRSVQEEEGEIEKEPTTQKTKKGGSKKKSASTVLEDQSGVLPET